MSPLSPLFRSGGVWIPWETNPPTFPEQEDPFILGTTKPTLTAGPGKAGLRVADNQLSNYAGSFTNLQPGQTVSRLAISGVITMAGGDGPGIFEDCLVLYGQPPTWPPSTSTVNTYRGVSAFSPHSGLTFNHCELRPNTGVPPTNLDTGPQPGTYLSWDTYGIQGGDITVYRCYIHHGVDGITGQGTLPSGSTPGPRRTAYFYGNYIEKLQWYANDPGKVDGSHNDGIVGEGNADLEIIGNLVDNRQSNTLNNGRASCIFVNNNVIGNYDKVLITDNWLYPNEVTAGTAINIGANPCNNLTMLRNRIFRVTNTGAGKIFVQSAVRSASTTDLGLSLGGTGTAVIGKCNTYMDDGSPYPISNG